MCDTPIVRITVCVLSKDIGRRLPLELQLDSRVRCVLQPVPAIKASLGRYEYKLNSKLEPITDALKNSRCHQKPYNFSSKNETPPQFFHQAVDNLLAGGGKEIFRAASLFSFDFGFLRGLLVINNVFALFKILTITTISIPPLPAVRKE